MKRINTFTFATYHVMHPKNEVCPYKSMPLQDVYALFDLMPRVWHELFMCLCQVSDILILLSERQWIPVLPWPKSMT